MPLVLHSPLFISKRDMTYQKSKSLNIRNKRVPCKSICKILILGLLLLSSELKVFNLSVIAMIAFSIGESSCSDVRVIYNKLEKKSI